MRCATALIAAAVAIGAAAAPGGDLAASQRGAKPRLVTRPQPAVCTSDLGAGVKTRRRFCAVIIATLLATAKLNDVEPFAYGLGSWRGVSRLWLSRRRRRT